MASASARPDSGLDNRLVGRMPEVEVKDVKRCRRQGASLGSGEPLQFRLAPLQHADIFEQPFQTVAIQRINNFILDGRDRVGNREGVFQPAKRPLPRFFLKANAEFDEAIRDTFGFVQLPRKVASHLLQLLGELYAHANAPNRDGGNNWKT